ncbi:hypothetical protein [Limnohabitans sp. Rim28]|nr:hypothetical protein [Limnohabitans sp. Rim28]
MAIALCSPDGKRHLFLRCNFFTLQLFQAATFDLTICKAIAQSV